MKLVRFLVLLGCIPDPAHALGDDNQITLPAGSEDLARRDRHLTVIFEGGSKHYRKRWRRMGAMIEDRILQLDLKRLPPP